MLPLAAATAFSSEPAPLDRTQAQAAFTEANAAFQKGEYAEALALAERALAIREHELPPEHTWIAESVGHLANVEAALGNLALVRRDRGDLDDALALFAEDAELCRRLGSTWGLQANLGNQAGALRQLGRYDEALADPVNGRGFHASFYLLGHSMGGGLVVRGLGSAVKDDYLSAPRRRGSGPATSCPVRAGRRAGCGRVSRRAPWRRAEPARAVRGLSPDR